MFLKLYDSNVTTMPESVNFNTVGSFKHSITDVDFANFLKYAQFSFSLLNRFDFIWYFTSFFFLFL